MSRNTWRKTRSRCLAAGATIALLILVALPALAQNTGAFTVNISEKEMLLEKPNDMRVQKYVARDLGFQRMYDRNMPYIELINDLKSTSPISEFHLTIGDTRFNFASDYMGHPALLGSTTPGFRIESSTVGNLGDELVVKILDGGLAPGDILRFKIDLGVDAQYLSTAVKEGQTCCCGDQFFQHPDYRTVLFDMNGLNVYDGTREDSTADNARATAIFDPTIGPDFSPDPIVFKDALIGPDPQFYNNHYRRYNQVDPVQMIFEATGSVPTVPEPNSMALGLVGVLAGLALSRRFQLSTRRA